MTETATRPSAWGALMERRKESRRQRAERNEQALRLLTHHPPVEVAKELGVTKRTVERIRAAGKTVTDGLEVAAQDSDLGAAHRVTPAVPSAVQVPIVGARRRMRGLVAFGHPPEDLAGRLGLDMSDPAEQRVMHGLLRGPKTVRLSTIDAELDGAITRMFNHLQMVPGPSEEAREYAHGNGWQLPFQWDEEDLNDPAAHPFQVRRRRMEIKSAVRVERREAQIREKRDERVLRLLANHSAREVAEMVGITDRTVERIKVRRHVDAHGRPVDVAAPRSMREALLHAEIREYAEYLDGELARAERTAEPDVAFDVDGQLIRIGPDEQAVAAVASLEAELDEFLLRHRAVLGSESQFRGHYEAIDQADTSIVERIKADLRGQDAAPALGADARERNAVMPADNPEQAVLDTISDLEHAARDAAEVDNPERPELDEIDQFVDEQMEEGRRRSEKALADDVAAFTEYAKAEGQVRDLAAASIADLAGADAAEVFTTALESTVMLAAIDTELERRNGPDSTRQFVVETIGSQVVDIAENDVPRWPGDQRGMRLMDSYTALGRDLVHHNPAADATDEQLHGAWNDHQKTAEYAIAHITTSSKEGESTDNPEKPVLDEIDQLVDWQIREGVHRGEILSADSAAESETEQQMRADFMQAQTAYPENPADYDPACDIDYNSYAGRWLDDELWVDEWLYLVTAIGGTEQERAAALAEEPLTPIRARSQEQVQYIAEHGIERDEHGYATGHYVTRVEELTQSPDAAAWMSGPEFPVAPMTVDPAMTGSTTARAVGVTEATRSDRGAER